MTPRFNKLLKSFATIVCGIMVVAVAYAPMTAPRAHAIPVFDVANFVTNTIQTTIVETLNGIAWAVAKTAIQSMTKSIVNWINSGYQGEPAFSQNMQRDLRQVSDAAANLFLFNLNKSIQTGLVDSPFVADIAQLSVNAYLLATSDDILAQRLKYTLLNHTQDSVAYMRGDFAKGGLPAWHSLIFQCGNDPLCVSFSTQEQLLGQIDAQARTWLADYNNGRGFLSWRGECQLYESAQNANNSFRDQCVADAEANGQDPALSCLDIYEDNVSLGDEDTCIEYDVLTPGSIVEETLGITVNSPLRQLELADSINEIVGAVVTQMVSQVLGESGLFGLSSPRSGGGGRPIDQATNPNANGTTIGAGFESVVAGERDRTLATRNAWVDIRDKALEADNACSASGGALGAIRDTEIQETIQRANEGIARAESALASLENVLLLLEETVEGEPSLFSGSQASSSQRAWELYQRLLSQGQLLTSQEHGTAGNERSEESDSDSLYLRMQELVDDCD